MPSTKSPKDFFRPLAVGAPDPADGDPGPAVPGDPLLRPQQREDGRQDPADGRHGRRAARATSRTPSRPTTRSPPARAWSGSRRRPTSARPSSGPGSTPSTAPGCSTTSPRWSRRSATSSTSIMVPKVQGAEDIHYVDRLLAQLEAKAGLSRPILVHAILETARGVANVEEICGASPRMQGLSLGPADLAADRRMKTTRVGGGHPGYLVRQDPVDGRRRRHAHDVPAGPVALHDRPHGRRLRDARDLPLLRPVRRHRRRGRLRGPVPQRVPARLRRHLEPAPQADRDRQPGLLPSVEDIRARPPRRRRDGRRHRRGDARRQDGGRRLAQAVPGDGASWPSSWPRSTPPSRRRTTRSRWTA